MVYDSLVQKLLKSINENLIVTVDCLNKLNEKLDKLIEKKEGD